MRTRTLVAIAAIAGLAAACAAPATPVPMIGPEQDIAELTGEWVGDYSSSESGRSGTIVFNLTAGSDTARGDVVMVPPGRWTWRRELNQPGTAMEHARQLSQVLAVTFVLVEGDEVSGVLDPYRDPTCGCVLRTTFIGRLRADTLDGRYTSLQRSTGEVQSGRWRAVRSR